MKLLTIEQVDNGYIVTNKPERDSRDAMFVSELSGVRVFETFASMSKWLEGHFEAEGRDLCVGSPAPHLGADEL